MTYFFLGLSAILSSAVTYLWIRRQLGGSPSSIGAQIEKLNSGGGLSQRKKRAFGIHAMLYQLEDHQKNSMQSQLGGSFDEVRQLAIQISDDQGFSATRDSNSPVLQVLQTLGKNIQKNREAEQLDLEYNYQARSALDDTNASVLVADLNHKITYANPSMNSLFEKHNAASPDLVEEEDENKLVGTFLAPLLKNHSHLLEDLQSAHHIEVSHGEKTYAVTISPVFDRDNKQSGSVSEWLDRTSELKTEKEVRQVVASVVTGDLSQRINLADKNGFFHSVSESVNALVAQLGEAMHQVNESAESVKCGTQEIAQGNMDLSERTQDQATRLEETSSTMAQMTNMVEQNAESALTARDLSSTVSNQATQGQDVLSRAVQAMDEISSASRKIADIIGVIDEIAFQTNLLALNASVEAARAGDQGRGFAVVAGEVRNLAGRSATAAKEIKQLIQDSVTKVQTGTELVNESGKTLNTIADGILSVTKIVAEIATASEKQASGVKDVNETIHQLDGLTQQNAALVEEAAAASSSIQDQAEQLSNIVGGYTL